jgi:SAM-dependent methyltransferase
LSAFACPACRTLLRRSGADLACACGARYRIDDGVPLLAPETDEDSRRQAEWFDGDGDPEWEIERPAGAPPLYRWLMHEKFRRAAAGVPLAGASALVVCAGSGMDAELLARAGADVTAIDISPGAARRSLERARRHSFRIVSAVGDAARLPFLDRSFDVVYVHDGLHHLSDPFAGVGELARVARRAVCISEPARASLTSLAVRLGLALEREDAGNVVARLDPAAVSAVLRSRGFDILRADRYGMYYRHEPGRVVRALSRRVLLGVAVGGLRLANAVAGEFGNKLVVVGMRA